ncbi:hypothetical protein BKP37_04020 [Anaerobacillus alkalilacustris]|uniref:Serine aminopeptidase S33 domain-containing protein n=1 Tax=Anaerobacillus alkalilacustris TaxID=393763 RepID=A0A1S2M1U5_9BACI|nr:alpha/beta fold hydrolase [Anaerobacillus alkalilacustris]OIJ17625.1 hypothetical protein BKP37_04020 [Anaerobacillus alkalilacustris]
MTKLRVEINDPIIDKYIDGIERVETIYSDGLTISSWQFKVDNPKGIVIVTHGMHGMDASSMLDYGMFFKKEGYETFVLDMRAHGFSDGDTIGLGYTEVKDFSVLLDWINSQEEYENKPIILYGFSMGGTTAIK